MQLNTVFDGWLKTNHITEQVRLDFGISYENDEIVIPVRDATGNHLFNKYRRSPLATDGPKYRYDKGGKVTLFALHAISRCDSVLITEGEKDALVAWSHNIPAVTSTGGAMSFQKEWRDYFESYKIGGYPANTTQPYTCKEVTICYDNDPAGAEGMVRTLAIIPWAKVLLLPDMPNVKDISDYVNMGGNLHELIKTARHYDSLQAVAEDRLRRIATFQSVHFHDAYIKEHTRVQHARPPVERKKELNDAIANARAYPIPNLIQFRNNACVCPFHNEKTPSLHYYERSNSCYCFGSCGKAYDAIDIYRHQTGKSFKEAVNDLNKM